MQAPSYPVFDSLGGVRSFLLGVVMLKDVYNSHEVHLLPGSSCGVKQNENLYTCTLRQTYDPFLGLFMTAAGLAVTAAVH